MPANIHAPSNNSLVINHRKRVYPCARMNDRLQTNDDIIRDDDRFLLPTTATATGCRIRWSCWRRIRPNNTLLANNASVSDPYGPLCCADPYARVDDCAASNRDGVRTAEVRLFGDDGAGVGGGFCRDSGRARGLGLGLCGGWRCRGAMVWRGAKML
jgi:hypothetical protein